MTVSKHAPGYVSNPDYSQEDWDEVSDNPELTDAEIAELRPNGEGLPAEMADAFRRLAGRPKSENKAVPVSLRIPPDVLAAYKAAGPGWQTRMNEALAAGLDHRRETLLESADLIKKLLGLDVTTISLPTISIDPANDHVNFSVDADRIVA